MKKKIRSVCLSIVLFGCGTSGLTGFFSAQSQSLAFSSNRSLSWEESIEHYAALDASSEEARLISVGMTDIGKPIHLFIINRDGQFDPDFFDRDKVIVMINNSIHPGEPDGADACAHLCSELLRPGHPLSALLDQLILCVIPVFNVDGALRRNATTRVNQDGPELYGFRGNARNLDLNRDFIKCDSENARSFSRIFTRVRPHVFVDTHVSNGADYAYTMTLITTQTDKLGGILGSYLKEKMEPALFESMEQAGHPMSPYVNTMGRQPESGLVDFLETPRFSTGYAALFNTLGFVTETHMLKPFPQRVEATHAFLETLLRYCRGHAAELVALRKHADESVCQQLVFPLKFELDSVVQERFRFRGYEGRREMAGVGTGERLRYDRARPWDKEIPHYRKYREGVTVTIPRVYLVPQAWREVVERLQCNRVLMRRMERDTLLRVEATFIESHTTADRPYEGHFVHSNVKVRREVREVRFFAGDWIVYTDQPARRYLVETLEPQGEDSFFCWNFFDSVLQQKEWFSDYVFEDVAVSLLEHDAELKHAFDAALDADPELRENHWKQLYWVYLRSPHYEGTVNMLPVFRYHEAIR